MTRVRLELNQLRVFRPKTRWKIYFVVVADHPERTGEVLVSVVPSSPIPVVPDQHNVVNFEPTGKGTEGLLLLSRKMPSSRELNVHFYVMHSRRAARDIGTVLKEIKSHAGKNAMGIVESLGVPSPWLRLAREALPLVGSAIQSIPDRNLGFVSMFERFGPEFEQQVEVDRESRGGHVATIYTWSIED